MIFAPSLACARPLHLAQDIGQLVEGGMPFLHVDFMDGHAVPNLCMNLDMVRAIRTEFPQVILDGHLMVANPEEYVEPAAAAGLHYLSFPPHISRDPAALLGAIRRAGMKPGLVIDPEHRPSEYAALLENAEEVVVMSIKPGGVKRPFDPATYQKLDELTALRQKGKGSYLISVDGGINAENGRECRRHGADILILGYYAVFEQDLAIPQACERFKRQIMEE